MAFVFHDRVMETGTGTSGSFTLLGAVAQYQSFSVIGNGNECRYTVVDADGIKWGSFSGVWSTGGALSRTATHESSNGVGVSVTFSGGVHTIFVTPDTKAIYDSSTTQVLFNDGGTIGGDADFIYDKTVGYIKAVGATFGASPVIVQEYVIIAFQAFTSAPGLDVGGIGVLVTEDGATVQSFTGVDSEPAYTGAGTCGDLSALYGRATAGANGSVTDNAHGLWIGSLQKIASGTITNGYGIRVLDQTNATNNYSCWFGAGFYHFDALTASAVILTNASKNLTSVALTANAAQYLDGTGAFSTPAGAGTVTHTGALTLNALVLGNGTDDIKVTTTGTGIVTALGVNVGSAGSVVVNGGALGTPSSGTLTNCTGLPVAGITASTVTALGVGSIELGHASDTTLSRASAGVLAVEGVNVLTTATGLPLAGGTLSGNITLGENTGIVLDPAGSADGKYSGTLVTGTGGATIAFGDLITLDKDDSRWELVDISVAAAATGDARGLLGMAVTSSTDGGALTILLQGIIRADANFPALTIGAAVFASTTGDVVVAQPTTTDHVIRIVGHAMTADEMFFNPSHVWTTHT